MKIIKIVKGCSRKIQGNRWGEKYESFEAYNSFEIEVDVDSKNGEELKKINDELYELARDAAHSDVKTYIKEQRAKNKVE